MNKNESVPKTPGVWKILKVVLPLVFLLTGFFGVQIWMVWDERDTPDTEKAVALPVGANGAKADVAKLTQPQTEAAKPVVVTAEKPAAESEQAISAEIPGLEYYRLQVGSFQETSGAEKLKKKLLEMGYGSTVIIDEQLSEVVAMSFFSREQAEALQKEMQSQAVSCFPKKIAIPPRMVLLKGDSRRLQDFLDGTLIEIPEMLREICDYYYLYEGQGMDATAHEALILKQIATVSDMKTGVENMQVGLEDQALQAQLKDYLNGYLQYLEKVRKIKKFDRKILWPGLLERIELFGHLGVQKSVN